MKALVMHAYGEFFYEDVPIPEITDTQVLVQVKAVAICGSDVIGALGITGRRIPPLIMGHEAAGVIVRMGKAVTGWNVNDRVTFDSTEYCGTCNYCKRGEINLCDHRHVLGVSCDEYKRNGAMAEYIAIESRTLYRIPDSVSFREACLVEPFSIGMHAVMISPMRMGDTVVVYGVGTIGLMVLNAVVAGGAGKVVAIDIDDSKLAIARSLGAIVLNCSQVDVKMELLKLNPNGADVAFDAVGIENSNNTAISLLRKGGTLIMIGNAATKCNIPLQYCVTRQIRLQGSCASAGEYDVCLSMMANKKVNLSPFEKTIMPLSEGSKAFQRLLGKEKGLLKVILEP